MTWEDRLYAEYNDLNIKLNKLTSFISSSKYNTLSKEAQDLLDLQFSAMNTYLKVLAIRMNNV